MARVEVKTRMKVTRSGEAEVIMDVLFIPRGSGNRNKARALGQAFRNHPKMKVHIKRVVVGSSRVTVHMRSSLALMKEISEMWAERRMGADVPGQLPLFAT